MVGDLEFMNILGSWGGCLLVEDVRSLIRGIAVVCCDAVLAWIRLIKGFNIEIDMSYAGKEVEVAAIGFDSIGVVES